MTSKEGDYELATCRPFLFLFWLALSGPCPALPCPALPCLALPCPALPCLTLPCLVLSCLVLACLVSKTTCPPPAASADEPLRHEGNSKQALACYFLQIFKGLGFSLNPQPYNPNRQAIIVIFFGRQHGTNSALLTMNAPFSLEWMKRCPV